MHEQKMQVLQGSVSKLLRRGAATNLRKALGKIHPADIAHLFRYFPPKDQKKLLEYIQDLERAADVFSEIESDSRVKLAELLDKKFLISLVQRMADDDSAELIRSLPEDLAEVILSALHTEHSEDVEQLLGYGEQTAGGIMSTDVFSSRRT